MMPTPPWVLLAEYRHTRDQMLEKRGETDKALDFRRLDAQSDALWEALHERDKRLGREQ